MDTEAFTIGRLSKETGCNIETVRYYEKIGLLPAPPRTGGGHRIYGLLALKRLTFIRRGRELGFTLSQVRDLLALVDGGHLTCEEVHGMTLEHLAEVQRKIASLRRLEHVLAGIANQCTGGQVPDCPVIDALFEPT